MSNQMTIKMTVCFIQDDENKLQERAHLEREN